MISTHWKSAYDIAGKSLTEAELTGLQHDAATVFSVVEAVKDSYRDRDENMWKYTKKSEEVVVLRDRFDRI